MHIFFLFMDGTINIYQAIENASEIRNMWM